MVEGVAQGAPVGVVGGGTMGAGIVQVAAAAGHPVVLVEVDQERADAAVRSALEGLQRSADKGRTPREVVERASLTASTSVADLADCSLVVEAVAERLDVKQALLRSVEEVVAGGCVLATNTSSISIDAIASALADPARLVGMHFFNPAPVMRLVEVVSGLQTSPDVADLVEATATAWGKTVVRCASSPGFVVNRVARPYYSEALDVVGETRLDPALVDELYRDAGGFRLGPFELTDLIGQDVNAAVTESVWRALDLDPRYRPSLLQRSLVEAGRLGRKTGRGFHDHRSPAPVRERVLPEATGGVVRVGPGSPLRPLLSRTRAELQDDAGLGTWAALPSGTHVGLTQGELAAEAAARLQAEVVLVDLCLDPATTTRVGATGETAELAGLLAGADVAVTVLPDVPGLLLARTVALLVDEAVDLAARQGLAGAAVDEAVRLGLSYPLGPCAWGDRVGVGWIVRVLDQLERLQPGGRFRVSTALRLAALRSTRLA